MLKILIVFVFAIITGTLVLRALFKNSIFLPIGIIWIANVFFTVINSKIHYVYPEAYPFWAALVSGLSVTAILLFIVSRWIRIPLARLIESIKILSSGDINTSQKEELKRNYKGELNTLKNSIINLSEIFKTSLSSINHSAVDVDKMGQEANHIAQTLSKGNNEQASSIEEISASMEEMNANINSSNENASKTFQSTSETNEKIKMSANSASELNKAILLIAEKIKVIDSIATETNLLALNAAIEAKQAGEAGAGFSVVASEVKKLAETSKKAADDIQSLTTKGLNLSEWVNQQLEDAIPSMETTMNLMEEISVSSQELKSGSDQVTSAINSINSITQSNAKLAEEMNHNSGKLSNQSNQLIKNIDFFKF
ncbi:methyl-accepting chemotaxis protein [Plebeiibacterium marinum]|uniref:Methyl-accepting chemotaxis protein n=1 Tax=Plebeiibacterium marinum TaxID=2992111 RepID=A0AAE3SMR6_9BACT|nr:methyl-accepting chemotaxis protein [Plebeiobacterium marinum]MCW3807835.1 methyl-accepting chemotaxis protein [Plebeiobacterium marinum]